MKIAAKRKVTLTVEVKDEAGNVEGTFKATFRVPTLTQFKGNLDDTAMLDSFLESVSDLELVDENGQPYVGGSLVDFVKSDLILSAATAAALVQYRGAQFRKSG